MAYPVYVQPDAVLAMLQYLRLRTELMALIASDHIVTEIPTSPTYPYVLVQLAGGSGIWPAIDNPTMQVDAVGGTKAACSLIARTVRACVWSIANDVVPAGVLSSGHEEMAPAYIPDTVPTPPLPRFTARYSVLLHP
jgi:hypothetical protein